MPIRTANDLFTLLLSELRQGAERTVGILQELGVSAQDPDIKEALEARAPASERILNALDACFQRIGQKPVDVSARLFDLFLQDFRKQFAEIQSPEAKRLFILVRAEHLIHLRIGQYTALIATADLAGHSGVRVLLEGCLADALAAAERTGRLIRELHRELVPA
jgi:ferritin-like metal-binding protein YciE